MLNTSLQFFVKLNTITRILGLVLFSYSLNLYAEPSKEETIKYISEKVSEYGKTYSPDRTCSYTYSVVDIDISTGILLTKFYQNCKSKIETYSEYNLRLTDLEKTSISYDNYFKSYDINLNP
ncbi:hypothetical protein [Candidatus Venteria ishoeyi]|uniref:Uncharacterized protein n=1 Tax=Candidatus Venteria ishoeyi TaxID=1899563 RepID=A0A1H6F6I6_9GAMM|nr:hypothetical protein [Candidatus Venteria ishoeyi]SEH05011.1 Uncharacterised protein [Candidatus Venteria ishoeyi]